MHHRSLRRVRSRFAAVLIAIVSAISLASAPGVADTPAPDPGEPTTPAVEDYAGYEPQTTCSPKAKPGTLALSRWIVTTYGGRAGGISRACGGSVSEHKEGRAFDWMLNARSARDRARAAALLAALVKVGPSGEEAELARRMGVMYVIWNDRMYSSYNAFRPRAYRSSACRKRLAKCSPTLRHRDHMHISLSRAGGQGATSWYLGRVPTSGRV